MATVKYSISQLSLLHNLAAWYLKSSDHTETFVVCQKKPDWDFMQLQKVEARVWVKGYAKAAKALCQHVILVDYGHSEYWITEYGIGELRRLGLIDIETTQASN